MHGISCRVIIKNSIPSGLIRIAMRKEKHQNTNVFAQSAL